MNKLKVREHTRRTTGRRTQAERRASTRTKAIAGTIELIRRTGMANVTVANIVTQTGVSWGAMQNLFGTKDYVLVAICEEAIGTMIGRLDALSCPPGSSVAQRVRAIIDCTRAIFEEPAFSVAAEIYRNAPQDEAVRRKLRKALREGRANMDRTWRHLFDGTRVDSDKLIFARHLVSMALFGLSARNGVNDPLSYEWQIPYDSFAERAIDFLVEHITALLEPEARPRSRGRVVGG